MKERLTIQHNDPPVLSVVSLTRAGAIVTATTATPHGYLSTDYVTVAGAVESLFNGKFKITVTGATTFTYVGGSGAGATGTISVKYTSNAAGGQGANGAAWRDLATVRAEMVPLTSNERLQLAAIQSTTTYRFRVRMRTDLLPTMRALWTPSWPPSAGLQVLQITGIIADDAELVYQLIETAAAA
jgi:head-tail adaptor